MKKSKNVDMKALYDVKYAKGDGWRYKADAELAMLQTQILDPIGLTPPAKVLDLGCGEGFHAALFDGLGFDTIGVDLSRIGIAHAKSLHAGPKFVCADAAEWLAKHAEEFDLIFSRGCSWWHYELSGVNAIGVNVDAVTRATFEAIKPGGHFVLQIATDFSGDTNRGVHRNTLADYLDLGQKHGAIVSVLDWKGRDLASGVIPAGANGVVLSVQRSR